MQTLHQNVLKMLYYCLHEFDQYSEEPEKMINHSLKSVTLICVLDIFKVNENEIYQILWQILQGKMGNNGEGAENKCHGYVTYKIGQKEPVLINYVILPKTEV